MSTAEPAQDKIRQLTDRLRELQQLEKVSPHTAEVLDRLLDSINGETKSAVENAKRVVELATLSNIGQTLSSAATLTVDEILNSVYQQVSLLMDTRNFYVAFYDADNDRVEFPFAMEKGKRQDPVRDWKPRKAGRGLTEYVIRHGQPLFIPENAEKWVRDHSDQVLPLGHRAESWLGAPLIAGQRVLGVIAVQNYEQANAYDEHDRNILSTVASQAAIAIANARLLSSTQAQVEDLRLLREVGQAIASTMDSREVLQRVVQSARTVVGADIAALYPLVQGVFQPPAIDGARRAHKLDPMPKPGGVASSVLEKGAVVVEDLEKEPRLGSRFTRAEGIRSFMGVALRVGGKVEDGQLLGGEDVGVLYVDFRSLHAFPEDARSKIALFATQAAISIANSRLFEASEQRSTEIQRLAEVGQRIVLSPQDVKQVLQGIVQQGVDTLGAHLVNLYVYHQSQRYFELPPIQAGELLVPEYPPHAIVDKDDIAFKIAASGIPQYAERSESDNLLSGAPSSRRAPGFPPFVVREKIVSSAGVPLKIPGETVGVIFFNYRTPRTFDEHHKDIIQTFANYSAIAIQNARLFDAAQARTTEVQRLAEVGQQILRRPQNLREVLQDVVAQAVSALGADLVKLYLYDQARDSFDLPSIWAGESLVKNYPEPKELDKNDIAFKVVRQREVQYTQDAQTSEMTLGGPSALRPSDAQPFVVREKIASSAGIPLTVADKTVGVMFVNYRFKQAFEAHQRRMIETFANFAAIAIHHSRLFDQISTALERRVAELAALAAIDEAITTRGLDEVLNRILDAALTIIRTSTGNVMLTDKSGNYVELKAVRGSPWADSTQTKLRIGKHGVSGWVAKYKQSALIANVHDERWKRWYIAAVPETRSELAVPLLDESNQLLGLINLESPQVGAFSLDDQQILEAFARQAVIAIRNAQHCAGEQDARDRFEALYEVGEQILKAPPEQAETLSWTLPLQEGMERTEAHGAVAWLINAQGDQLEPFSPLGAAQSLDLNPVKIGETCVNSWVAQHKQKCYVPDVGHPPEPVGYRRGHADTRSELVVPLLAGDSYFGNLDFGHPQKNGFGEEDIRLIEGLADQAAAAIHRIRQQKELEAANERKLETEWMASVGQSALELTHRIGNGLGGIAAYIKEISAAVGQQNDDVKARLSDISRDTEGVLDFARKLRGIVVRSKEVSEKKWIPSQVLLNNAVQAYPVEPHVEVSLRCPEDVPAVWVDDRAFDVFVNLFTNAVQALPPEGGKVEMGARLTNHWVEFWVTDNGCGISESSLRRIWQLFYSTKKGGFGFGLWSVRQAVIANGGEVSIQSRLRKGTTFTVRLPAKE